MPTKENLNRVSLMLVKGWSNERIAAAMQISQPILRKYYFPMLDLKRPIVGEDAAHLIAADPLSGAGRFAIGQSRKLADLRNSEGVMP